jgi:hypothetical protein
VLGVLDITAGAVSMAGAVRVPDNSPGAAATSTCSFDGSGFWWMRLGAPALFFSPNSTSLAATDLSGAAGGWPASGVPAACALSGGGLYVAVSAAPDANALSVYAAAPALPTVAAGLTWTAVATLAVPGGGVTGFALSSDALSLFIAVTGGGVQKATRAAGGVTPFSAFTPNAAAASVAAIDVVVNANGLSLFVLSPWALASVDLRAPWDAAPLVNVTSAVQDGTNFLGVAVARR